MALIPIKICIYGSRAMDEIMSWIFIRELYLCTCKMEVREKNMVALVKKITASAVVTIFVSAMDEIWNTIGDEWWRNAVINWRIFSFAFSAMITGSLLYLGCHVLSSLRKNAEFREGNVSRSNAKTLCLVVLVVIIMTFQSLKLVTKLALISFAVAMDVKVYDCTENATPDQVLDCDDLIAAVTTADVYMNPSFLGLLELFVCLLLPLWKRRLSSHA